MQRTAQHLATLAEGRANHREEIGLAHHLGVHAHAGATHDLHEGGVDLGFGHEDVGAHLAHDGRVGEVLHSQRHRTVRLVAGVSRETLAHFLLHHHEHPRDEGHGLEQVQHEGRRHVVGQIGHHGRRAVQHRQIVRAQRVGVVHHHPVGLHDRLERGEQVAVDFHRADVGAGLDEGQGERAQPRTDLEDLVAFAHAGQTRNSSNRVGVDHEVLAEGA